MRFQGSLTVAALLALAGCSHDWERPGGIVGGFESPYGPDTLEPVYGREPPSPMSGKRYMQDQKR